MRRTRRVPGNRNFTMPGKSGREIARNRCNDRRGAGALAFI
jgi:hypothetical protein